jgi:hypothetical protein
MTSFDVIPAKHYTPSTEGRYRINPEVRQDLHCQFAMALKAKADEAGWILRLVPEYIPGSDFPEICLIPPGQDKASILHSFRIDAGVPETISEDEYSQPYVDRIIRFAGLTQRAFAGPVETHLPGILSSFPIATFTRNGAGAYDPKDWAEAGFKMAESLWKERNSLSIFLDSP